MKGSTHVRVALDESGSESEYDFVFTPPSSPRTAPQSESPLVTKGWSTLEFSEVIDDPFSGEARLLYAAGADTPTATSEERGPLFNCAVCGFILRDCVECPRCHSLFCRSHLRIDENGECACPCEPCVKSATGSKNTKSGSVRVSNTVAADSFLPNIPVQRMADAVPSSCEWCGISLTWGELGSHMCDLQIVSCEDARWGCPWTGKRVDRPAHMASSTCAGRIARIENKLAEARTELSKARAEVIVEKKAREVAERRASAAESENKELKLKVAKQLRAKEAATASAAQATAALAKVTKASGAGCKGVAGGSRSSSGGDSSGGLSPGSSATVVGVGGQASPSSGQMQQEGQESEVTAAFPGVLKHLGRLKLDHQQRQHHQQHQQHQRQAGVISHSSPAVDARGRPLGQRGTVEGAPTVTIPATEACLRPYLERPDSLLEKKVVVFWPRQGRWYVGRPTVYKPMTKEHRVEYDDGDVRDHVLAHRAWGLIG